MWRGAIVSSHRMPDGSLVATAFCSMQNDDRCVESEFFHPSPISIAITKIIYETTIKRLKN